jgi:hypothetical protein
MAINQMDWVVGISDIEVLGLVSDQWKTCILHEVLFALYL